ncbi:MAG: hypothetical protein Ct9H90mP3_2920 [Flammeovirgaceae bacterium]|nr:MAG: hypothetical protein Ct9H90mP3_2920 [Flammeovirgaceae bacterium]
MKNLILIIICLLTYSCSNKKPVQNEEIIEAEPNSKRVFFKWPKDGATVASPVFIDMGVEGMLIEPQELLKKDMGITIF